MRARSTCFALALACAAVLGAGGCSRQEEYPQAVRDEFTAGCIPAAKTSLAATVSDPVELERKAKAYCACSLEKTMKAYTLKEFIELETVMKMGAQLDPAAAKKLASTLSECQLLFQPKK
ncbi:MAG: hypothetical protein ACLGSA_07330 [Acidobacteriota bacterium]